jgi:hypothetical protein
MAVHRAVHLANPSHGHGGRTLLVTYNKSLVAYLAYLTREATEQLDVATYHSVMRGYLNGRGKMRWGAILAGPLREQTVRSARATVKAGYDPHAFFSKPVEFFEDELDWISRNGVETLPAYLDAKRKGRQAPLGGGLRKIVWQIRAEYLRVRNEKGFLYDWWELPTAVRAELADDERPRRYKHIVIDEGQDLPPEAIRSLVELVDPEGSLTMFADYAQQLYGQRNTYASAGLSIAAPEVFKENYRNSPGIARLAIEMSHLSHFSDSLDLVEPNNPVAAGIPPTLFKASTYAVELSTVRDRAKELGKTGTVAIVARTWREARSAARTLAFTELNENKEEWSDAPGVYIGTFHAAKGLEFDAVIMPFAEDSAVPGADSIEALGEAEAFERAANLLYVGVTRARSELLVTYQDRLTRLLPPPESGLWTVTQA